jgi:uncharacterized membrane protein YbhN (UPF0104 family)
MRSVEERQDELRRIDLWLQQHPMQSNLIAVVMGLLLFAFCNVVLDPPDSTASQLFCCLLVVLLAFETIVLILPGKWREKIGALQFGLRWGDWMRLRR